MDTQFIPFINAIKFIYGFDAIDQKIGQGMDEREALASIKNASSRNETSEGEKRNE